MIHLYIGDGKGKSTAAAGLAVRAAGAGRKVYFAIFLKDSSFDCCEARILRQAGICVKRFKGQVHPIFVKDRYDRDTVAAYIDKELSRIEKYIHENSYDFFVLDELLNAWAAGLVTQERLLTFIKNASLAEMVFTGRKASFAMMEAADYVSIIKKVRHPFDKKIFARRGIEY